jgi:putative thioredoxin
MVHEVSEADFTTSVLERSRKVPVVVDFWAEWCGPCRQLGPALEAAVAKRGDELDLAKVDVDANQSLAASFGIRGIPAVKAFRDGEVVAEFTGAIPPAQIEAFLDRLVPSPADRLVAAGDEASLRKALSLDPRHSEAAAGLARLLIGRGEYDEARKLLEPLQGDFVAEGLTARAALQDAAGGNGAGPSSEDLRRAFAAWDGSDYEQALDALQEALAAETDGDRRDLIRRAMVGIFTELGADHALAREHRRRLAAALN